MLGTDRWTSAGQALVQTNQVIPTEASLQEDNGLGDHSEADPAVAAASQRFRDARPSCMLRLAE